MRLLYAAYDQGAASVEDRATRLYSYMPHCFSAFGTASASCSAVICAMSALAAFRSVCSVFVSGLPRASLIDQVCTQLSGGLYCRLASTYRIRLAHVACEVSMYSRGQAIKMPRKCCLNELIPICTEQAVVPRQQVHVLLCRCEHCPVPVLPFQPSPD